MSLKRDIKVDTSLVIFNNFLFIFKVNTNYHDTNDVHSSHFDPLDKLTPAISETLCICIRAYSTTSKYIQGCYKTNYILN